MAGRRDDDAQGMVEDFRVGRLGETPFANVVGGNPAPSQLLGGAARQPLVEQEL
jgi:hypothetical protein